MRRARFAVAALLLATSAAHAAPPPPTKVEIVPVYSATKHIHLSWTRPITGGTYNVHKQVDANPETLATVVPGGAVGGRASVTDDVVVPTAEYTYRIEVCNPTGCTSAPAFKTSVKEVWPISGGRRLIDGFNEVLAWAGPGNTGPAGYHDGVDLARTTVSPAAADDVRAPRGGVVQLVQFPPAPSVDDGFVQVKVDVGGGKIEYDGFNHIASGTASVMIGTVVAPGQKLAVMGTLHFNDPLTGATDFDDHVHFQLGSGTRQFAGAIRHPLTIFTDPADRDPGGNPPALYDENGDGKKVFYRSHASGALINYDVTTTPLHGDIDVEAEVTDIQGTKPHTIPVALGYWIEGPLPESEHKDDVKSAEHPYKLFDFHVDYWGDAPLVPCQFVSDLDDVANYGCKGVKAVGCTVSPPGATSRVVCNSTLKESGSNISWWWPILHHYVITHAATETGLRNGLNGNQFWRTAAKDDDQAVGSAHANYAGQPVTTNAWEARFPDGDYTIHLLAADLVYPNVAQDLPVARLENFAPFVKEIVVAQDADGNGTTGLPNLPGCEIEVYSYKHPARKKYPDVAALVTARGATAGHPLRAGAALCVGIRFSEPMVDVAVHLAGQRGTGAVLAGFAGALAKTFADNDTWRGTLTLVSDPTGDSDFTQANDEKDTALRIVANDRRDAGGVSRFLDRDGDGSGDVGGDVNHLVKIDLSPPKKAIDVVKP